VEWPDLAIAGREVPAHDPHDGVVTFVDDGERIMRRLFAVLLTAVFAAVPSSAAQAAGPDIIRLSPTELVFPADYCGFELLYTEVTQTEKLFFFPTRLLVAGGYVVRLTNQENGRSIVVNGSARQLLEGPTPLSTGPQIFLVNADETWGPGVFLVTGRSTFTRDENGLIDSITYSGTRSGNLCDQLR
jgi:hypothetical protein